MSNAIIFPTTENGITDIAVDGDYFVFTLDGGDEVEVTSIEEGARALAHFGQSWLGIMEWSAEAGEALAKMKEMM